MTRDPNDKVPITLRVPEWLRHRMEERAKRFQRSLNSQVVADLEGMVAQSDLVRARFGTEDIASFMQALSSCFVLAEMQSGKSFKEDADTMERALIAAQAILYSFRRNPEYPVTQVTADKAVGDAMEIARYAGPTFFGGVNIPEPDWLKAAVETMRKNAPARADEGK